MMDDGLGYIVEGLRGLAVPIDQVHEDAANARTGHAVERIAGSLRQYGQRKPIVANRLEGGRVIAGNGTLRAARSLGWSHIAVVWVEDDAATAVGFGIADNRVGDLSRWDVEALGGLLQAVDPDEVFTGFDAAEISAILEPGLGPGENGFKYEQQWAVTVVCGSEEEQESVYNDLTARGLRCRVVTV